MKKILPFAAAGMLLTLGSQAALAQSSVTMYGLLDLSLDLTHSGSQTTWRMLSGAQTGSRWGIRGSEDIGGGNHVNFVLEDGFNLANGAASDSTAAFNRQAWIGLSGRWGEVRIGRQNSPLYVPLEGKFDATGVSTIAGGYNSFATLSVRTSNAIFYQAPSVAGLTVNALVGLRDATTTPSSGINNYQFTAIYRHGPGEFDAGWQSVANSTNTATLRALFVGGSWDFGPIVAYGGFHNARESDGSEDRDVWTVSGAYKLDPFTTAALVYTQLNDRTAAGHNAGHVGVMLSHWFSKRTWIYASGAVLLNKGKSTYELLASTTPGVPVAYPGADVEGLELGIQHRF